MLPRFTRPLRRMSTLSHWLRRDLDHAFPRFQHFDVFENPERPPKVDENTYFRVEHVTNNNGHVKVKTAVKEPGKAWDIRVVEEYNKDNTSAIEQDKSQKKVEAIEQGKTNNTHPNVEGEKVDNFKETEAAPRNNNKSEANVKEEIKDKTENISDSSPKTSENTRDLKERNNGNDFNHDLARKYDIPYDEIQTIFDRMDRDFQDRFRKNFNLFESYRDHPMMRRGEYGRDHHLSRRYDSPFDEIEEMFDSMDRGFGNRFDYNPYHRHRGRNGYNHQDRELVRRGRSHFDEFDAIFDSMERDFENGFRKRFDSFENPHRRGSMEEDQAGNRKDNARSQEKGTEAQKADEANKVSN